MNISWRKNEPVMLFSRTLLIVLWLAVCAVTAQDVQTLLETAAAGDASAQFKIGLLYEEGWGVPEDDAEARKWYRKAAEQGHVRAQFNLGVIYDTGTGVPEDDAEALRQVLYGANSPSMIPRRLGWGFLALLPDRPDQGPRARRCQVDPCRASPDRYQA